MEISNKPKMWEDIFVEKEWGKYPPVSLIKFVASNFYHIANRNNIKILEIGCGPGANIWYMAREGFRVYGIDFSKTACSRLEERLKKENLAGQVGRILVGDYLDKIKEFPDNYFDAIVDVESLYCNSFTKSQSIISNCFKKLREGGLLFSQTFAENSYGFDSESVDYHEVIPTVGPSSNTGRCRFTTEEDINLLYVTDSSRVISIEKQELHMYQSGTISEWIIVSEKVTKKESKPSEFGTLK